MFLCAISLVRVGRDSGENGQIVYLLDKTYTQLIDN